MTGALGILNVGAGDTKLVFDPDKPDDVARSSAIVQDMLRRGFAIMIEVGKAEDGEPLYRRATAFDPKTCEYIIVGLPEDWLEKEAAAAASPTAAKGKAPAPRKGPRRGTYRVPAAASTGVAISRSAGG